tara:strand:- start:16874 stop:17122 length:249 start_codon:yes stop_codon:yes gene_type:complete
MEKKKHHRKGWVYNKNGQALNLRALILVFLLIMVYCALSLFTTYLDGMVGLSILFGSIFLYLLIDTNRPNRKLKKENNNQNE